MLVLSNFLCDRFFLLLSRTSDFQGFLRKYYLFLLGTLVALVKCGSLPTSLDFMTNFGTGIRRRFERMRRRRKVGRAYDMALEISRALPPHADVLDVGCGNGFIAHHLVGILRSRVVGVDVGQSTVAPINYLPYDGRHIPLQDQSFDAVLLCYVLHHAQDARAVLNEVARVLNQQGLVIIYEDIPRDWWDRVVCWVHNQQWHKRTGPCTFRLGDDWRQVFNSAGFEVIRERQLSRWRNVFHPVSRKFFVLKLNDTGIVAAQRNESSVAISAEEAYLAA